jgi:DNA-binding transcriptional ArsR family regulator
MMAAATTHPFAEEGYTTVDAEEDGGLLLEVLSDADSRSILRATGEEALSASEISEACDLPLSTTYRKLERMSEAGLLAEGIRLRRSGKHTSEYVRRVDDVCVSLGAEGGIELTLESNGAAAGSMAAGR